MSFTVYGVFMFMAFLPGHFIFSIVIHWRWTRLGLHKTLQPHVYSDLKSDVATSWTLSLCGMIAVLYFVNEYALVSPVHFPL